METIAIVWLIVLTGMGASFALNQDSINKELKSRPAISEKVIERIEYTNAEQNRILQHQSKVLYIQEKSQDAIAEQVNILEDATKQQGDDITAIGESVDNIDVIRVDRRDIELPVEE